MCTINLDHMMYSPSDMEPNRHIFVILGHFLLFYPPPSPPLTTWKFWKNEKKKPPGDIINLQTCTKNGHHMMHGSWDMEDDRENFLSVWAIFYAILQQPSWISRCIFNVIVHIVLWSLLTWRSEFLDKLLCQK